MRATGTGIFYLIGIILFFLGGAAMLIYGLVTSTTWAWVMGAVFDVGTVVLFIDYIANERHKIGSSRLILHG